MVKLEIILYLSNMEVWPSCSFVLGYWSDLLTILQPLPSLSFSTLSSLLPVKLFFFYTQIWPGHLQPYPIHSLPTLITNLPIAPPLNSVSRTPLWKFMRSRSWVSARAHLLNVQIIKPLPWKFWFSRYRLSPQNLCCEQALQVILTFREVWGILQTGGFSSCPSALTHFCPSSIGRTHPPSCLRESRWTPAGWVNHSAVHKGLLLLFT